MLFDRIHEHVDLYGLVRSKCTENNVGVQFSPDLLDADGDPHHEKVLVLKLDHFYCSERMPNPPPSPDCLVIVKCCEGNTYDFYLIENRNTKRTQNVKPSEISRKFSTALYDFLEVQFPDIFLADTVQIGRLALYLVTDPLKLVGKSDAERKAAIGGTVIEAYGFLSPLVFQGRALRIEPQIPDPTILNC